ncbi:MULTISPECIES: Druantia anti-phage system protein DruA [Bhargavaea]|uniref:Druantia anti-phage system protein DruA n=1 Tax=Bhargavaea changchunensis TaxID=2134037 RepID=A0ABW2NKM1_9BACL|nr:Druantia anti-phage system protein DruA [Bhargavaea sp. CC-171006]
MKKLEEINHDAEFVKLSPKLNEINLNYFKETIIKLSEMSNSERVNALNDLILSSQVNDGDIESYKMVAIFSLLRDLFAQQWRLRISSVEDVYVAPSETVKTKNKMYLRQQLQIERNAQLKKESVKKFINKMENPKIHNGDIVSIKSLIGDSSILLKKMESKKYYEVVDPYLQIIDKGVCEQTGYKLNEIWRYFRHTWSIPYKSTPGRNIFYLIRDRSQKYHPVMGIAALGNSVLQLSNRDNYIGWTLDSVKENLKQREEIIQYEEDIKGSSDLKRKVKKRVLLESKEEYKERVIEYSDNKLKLFIEFINNAINEVFYEDILSVHEVQYPTDETLEKLEEIKSNPSISVNKTFDVHPDTITPLFIKKRAAELLNLLFAKKTILDLREKLKEPDEILKEIVKFKGGKVVTTALQANRKTKIGSNMMEIIVCGAIPPYNEILAGKLTAMLMTSPVVVADYNNRYSNQISEIASRMKGESVVRDSKLAFLGTTSLYQIGSSQYNRIKIPGITGNIEYLKLGETEGFSSTYFSEKTTWLIDKMLIQLHGERKINNKFGEGTSPRMRLMRAGLSALGLPERLVKQETKRIIYGIDLAANTKEFLNGADKELEYYIPLDGNEEFNTDRIIEYWKKRWLKNRVHNIEVKKRLETFKSESILVSNYF